VIPPSLWEISVNAVAKTHGTSVKSEMNGAEREIRSRIAQHAAITFAEFMELALYHPEGYYSKDSPIGAHGDYFTSPVLHPAFGALIAVQLRVMWDTLGRPSPFWIVEPGARDGQLAADILSFADAHMGEFVRALRYVETDRSTRAIPHNFSPHASRLRASGLPLDGIVGCILSNELFDAFPVHRFRIAGGQVEEMYVSIGADGDFREEFRPPSTDRIAERLSTLPRQLPDGFRGEVNLGIGDWMTDAVSALDSGYVLTIDYGYEAEELYSDARARGTFQTYYKHVDGSSPFQRIGQQDMTAHVDFSALIAEGLNAGLRPIFLTTQTEFMKSLGFGAMLASLRESDLAHPVKTANLRAITELVKPDGLGKFRVLTQEKNSGITRSSDLLPSPERLAVLRAPLMTENHLYSAPLARYGYGETESDLRSRL
jgi:SAM-dependent MidA family methyltransferase